MHRLIVPGMVLLLWLAYLVLGSPAYTCPQGQIFIPRGLGGACVIGSWR